MYTQSKVCNETAQFHICVMEVRWDRLTCVAINKKHHFYRIKITVSKPKNVAVWSKPTWELERISPAQSCLENVFSRTDVGGDINALILDNFILFVYMKHSCNIPPRIQHLNNALWLLWWLPFTRLPLSNREHSWKHRLCARELEKDLTNLFLGFDIQQ